MTRKVTIFNLSLITKQTIDGAAPTHFNSVITQETRLKLTLKQNKKRVRPKSEKCAGSDPTHIVPEPNTCLVSRGIQLFSITLAYILT